MQVASYLFLIIEKEEMQGRDFYPLVDWFWDVSIKTDNDGRTCI